MGNGFKIEDLEPSSLEAQTLAKRGAGAEIHPDRKAAFVMRLFGKFPGGARINVSSPKKNGWHPYSVDVRAQDFVTVDGKVYEFALNKAVTRPLYSCRSDVKVEIIPLDNKGQPTGNKCVHMVHTFSPIVLNMAGDKMIETVNPLLSSTHFDLDANGTVERTGWIKGNSGLLALDLNNNGLIDDGSELFGEATLLNGKRARNGYEALKQHDFNRDQLIDSKDPVYKKLVVWFDKNKNGISEKHELRSFSELGVTGFSLVYETLSDDIAIQSKNMMETNIIKLKSKFFGPKACGDSGCASFDAYFGASETSIHASK